jgi:citrate synthase
MSGALFVGQDVGCSTLDCGVAVPAALCRRDACTTTLSESYDPWGSRLGCSIRHLKRNGSRYPSNVTNIKTLSTSFDWRADRIEWPVTTDVGPGLTGVVALETRVMWLDPSSGQLAYRGVPIEALASLMDFEGVAFLLITGSRPEEASGDFEVFRARLRQSRALPPDAVELIRSLDPETHPMRLLRAGLSAVGCHELTVDDDLAGGRQWQELRVVGQVAALVGEICRFRSGLPPQTVNSEHSLAHGLLAALTNRKPSPNEVRALDLLWVLYAAHGLDAPTFTSMIVASCHADPYYNFVAGLSALRGPKTGGAAEAVLQTILPLSDAAAAEAWVRETIDNGGIIPGFGHRVYHMPDPRVVVLRKEVAAMARGRGRSDLFEVARAVEVAATSALAARGVHINVNFYGALLFHLLGADPQLVPCLMAVGRMAGTTALVREALATIRLYRPLSRYVGAPERSIAGEPVR